MLWGLNIFLVCYHSFFGKYILYNTLEEGFGEGAQWREPFPKNYIQISFSYRCILVTFWCILVMTVTSGVPQGFRPWSNPVYFLFRGGHQHRRTPRSQGSRFRRRLTSLWSRRSRRCFLSGGSDGLMHRTCQRLDDLEPPSLNPSKIELIWLGSSRRLHHCPADKVWISDAYIQPAESVRDLGVLIDSAMTLTTHVNHLVGVSFFHLRQIRIIRRSLSTDAAHSLVRALIHARVDYCNGLLASCPKYLTERLQSVLRAAARLVLQLPYRSTVTDLMHRQLHWLDIRNRVRFKIGLLVFKMPPRVGPPDPGTSPITASRCQYRPLAPPCVRPGFRSAFSSSPRTRTKTIGPRGFFHASPAVWNSLPDDLRDPELSIGIFRNKLKTFLFSQI